MICPAHTAALGLGRRAELVIHAPTSPADAAPTATLRVKRGTRTLRRYHGPWTYTAVRAQSSLLRQAADALLAAGAPPCHVRSLSPQGAPMPESSRPSSIPLNRKAVLLFALWLNNTVVPDPRPPAEKGGPTGDNCPAIHLSWEPQRRGWLFDIHIQWMGVARSVQAVSVLVAWELLAVTRLAEDESLDPRLRAALRYATQHADRPPLTTLSVSAEA